jgi:hypothetical protein
VPHALRDFLGDENIRICGIPTNNDVKMLSYYDIIIPGARDLQRVIPFSFVLYSKILNHVESLFAINSPQILPIYANDLI